MTDYTTIEKKNIIQSEAEEAHENKNCRSTCCLSVGLGKGVLAIKRLNKAFNKNENFKALFVAPRKIHLENFKKEIIKFESEHLFNNTIFLCNKSLRKVENDFFDICIIDESHMEIDLYLDFIKKTIRINPSVEILCLTGTPKVQHENFRELNNYVPVSYEKIIDNAVKDKILNDYNIHVIFTNLNNVERREYEKYLRRKRYEEEQLREIGVVNTSYDFLTNKIKTILRNSEEKLEFTDYLLKTALKDKKTLIYLGFIYQTELFKCPSYHSKLTKEERKKNYESFVNGELLHLTNVNGLKESVSIPNLKYGIITYVDSSRQSMEQIVGKQICPQ